MSAPQIRQAIKAAHPSVGASRGSTRRAIYHGAILTGRGPSIGVANNAGLNLLRWNKTEGGFLLTIQYPPAPGTIVICDFKGFIQPEMIKRRPAVVVSPRLRNRGGLCTVVPFSTRTPDRIEDYHHKITFGDPLPEPYDSPFQWVKADMLCTVSLERLSFPWRGRKHDGSRNYIIKKVDPSTLAAIQRCVLHAIGMSDLVQHIDAV